VDQAASALQPQQHFVVVAGDLQQRADFFTQAGDRRGLHVAVEIEHENARLRRRRGFLVVLVVALLLFFTRGRLFF
jgi:hypothetical protein